MSPRRVIDIDPELLQRSATAALHAAEQAAVHVDGEVACRDESGVPKLLETLTPRGPWAWAIMPEIRSDGSVKVPIATTLEEIADWYRLTRGHSNVLGFEPLLEIRGAWYFFSEGISRSYVPSTRSYGETESIVLFPVTSTTGITGELAWWRMQRATLGRGEPDGQPSSKTDLELRRETLAQHDRYLHALRVADLEELIDTLHVDAQSAVRDYVDDTGTLVGLDGTNGHRTHYERLFDLFEIERVDLLHRVVQEWYMFAELRFTVRPRTGVDAGHSVAFHTAEFLITAADGRFIARIGHGTDAAVIGDEQGLEAPGPDRSTVPLPAA
jgi:hypothetical protein